MSNTIRPGLVSVTFRGLPRERVVGLAADNGLEGIEWGGDVHVPAGDLAAAAEAARLTRDAGLAVAAYGSYFRCRPEDDFAPVLASAEALGAPLVRVWAGKGGSDEADPAGRREVAGVLRDAAARAAERGIVVATEWHGNTLTDTPESYATLLAEVDHPNLRTDWQPARRRDAAAWRAELAGVLPTLAHLHVFHWRETGAPQAERRPLAEGAAHWPGLLSLAATAPAISDALDRFALLEFVRDDGPRQFADDAATLRHWLRDAP